MNRAASRRYESESFLPHCLPLILVAPMRLLLAALDIPVHGGGAWALAIAAALIAAAAILISTVAVCAAATPRRPLGPACTRAAGDSGCTGKPTVGPTRPLSSNMCSKSGMSEITAPPHAARLESPLCP